MSLKLVTKQELAVQNINQFQAELGSGEGENSLTERLAQFRAWYAIQCNGKWLFGPSKFVGYAGNTVDLYEENHDDLDGRETEKRLQQWFEEVGPGELQDTLYEELGDFLAIYGKQLNKLARVSVLRSEEDEAGTTDEAGLARALLTLFKSMPPSAQAEFRRSLNSLAP